MVSVGESALVSEVVSSSAANVEREPGRARLAHVRRDLDRAREAYWRASAHADPERYLAARERYYSLLLEEERLSESIERAF
jgi:hypothetical protein